jgi:DNA invertase Pin-like site-specific DNA recombinase
MKVALYARTATKQDKNSNKSIQNQLARLTNYAKENQLAISGVYYDVAGGNDLNRFQFGQMLRDIEAGEKKIQMIVCTSSDRFSRSLLTAVELLHKLLKAGVQIKFIDDTPQEVEFRRVESEILGTYYQKKKI